MTRIFRRAALAALAALATGAGCSALTDVSSPDIVQPPQLETPSGAEALTVGALSALYIPFFTLAYNSGVFSDEFKLASAFTTFADFDFRSQSLTFTEYGPIGMHAVRTQATQAIGVRQRLNLAPRSRIGQLFAVKAWAELFIGETSCNGTPLSEVVDLRPVFGGAIPSDSVMKRAIADFDSALVYAADSLTLTYNMKIGRGRALLNRGQFAQAATAVAGVPTTFVYNGEATTAVANQTNTIWNNNNNRTITVADREGTNGLDFVSANDPRVPTSANGVGTDGVTQVRLYTRYTGLASHIPIATGIEARLIEAEAALQANPNDGVWLRKLDSLRTTAITPAMTPLTDPGTAAGRVDLLFRERAFWLFATGHRMGDLRRQLRQYGRAMTSIYPVGPYKAGVNYGTDVVFILTLSEQSNPNVRRCTDVNP